MYMYTYTYIYIYIYTCSLYHIMSNYNLEFLVYIRYVLFIYMYINVFYPHM